MEHACYKCGATVEEGAPFCPECRAPQIRVNVPTAEDHPDLNVPATPPFPPGTPGELQPPARPVPLSTHIAVRDTLGTALAASIVMIVSWMLVPAGLIFATTAAGALAVLLYARRRPEIRLSPGNGAKIGMISGLASYVFFFVVTLLGYLVDRGVTFRQFIEQVLAKQPDSPTKQEVLKNLNSPDFMATLVVLLLIVVAVVLLGFSSLGGAIAARLLRRKNQF